MLVSALMGRERMQAAYAHAITEGYRFYRYGDASLLLPLFSSVEMSALAGARHCIAAGLGSIYRARIKDIIAGY